MMRRSSSSSLGSDRTGERPALAPTTPAATALPAVPSAPFASPPPFLFELLLAHLSATEVNWPAHLSRLRLVCHSWKAGADAALHALAPARHLPQHGIAAAATALRSFAGLRALRLRFEPLSRGDAGSPEAAREVAALLAAVAAVRCLRTLSLHGLPAAPSLRQLARLPHLSSLDLGSPAATLDLAHVAAAAARLPGLRRLALEAEAFVLPAAGAALPGFERLAALQLRARSLRQPALWPAVSGLTALRTLAVQARDLLAGGGGQGGGPRPASPAAPPALRELEARAPDPAFCQALPTLLPSLTALTSLSIRGRAPDPGAVPADRPPPTLPLAACARLRALSALVDALALQPPSEDYARTFTALSGLTSLALDFNGTARQGGAHSSGMPLPQPPLLPCSSIKMATCAPPPLPRRSADSSVKFDALVANTCRHATGLRQLQLLRDTHAQVGRKGV